jgi:hypothetical protein
METKDKVGGMEVGPSENQSGFPKIPEGTGGTFAEEIAGIAKEQGLAVSDDGQAVPQATPEPTQPVAEQAVETPTEPTVPEKFQAEDGSLDQAKLNKSDEHINASLDRYLEKEKDLRQKQAESHRLQLGQPAAAPQPIAQQPPQYDAGLDGFAKQIDDEVKLNGLGVTLAKLTSMVDRTSNERTEGAVRALAEKQELAHQRSTLKEIAKSDPWVVSPDGQKVLMDLRDQNDWLRHSPNPWLSAFEMAKGKGLVPNNSAAGVQMPTPKPEGAPVPPTSGPRQKESGKPPLNLNDKAALEAHLKTLKPGEEEVFWKKLGFPPITR